jgi:hypothetical protein
VDVLTTQHRQQEDDYITATAHSASFINGLGTPIYLLERRRQIFLPSHGEKSEELRFTQGERLRPAPNARKPHGRRNSMHREGLNHELGVVEQAVATEAAELAAMEVELADIEH